ncbi:N-glycosylase/DNA lyase [Phymastichus coffea]|uniref:N-glycosylase/DNA lyase n=1 Tax=Phymastichus coffea TaxID=108790 RepID=UPI00273C61CC|nr:N-glycosylase/DNA lyase [Phymastichus coffea]
MLMTQFLRYNLNLCKTLTIMKLTARARQQNESGEQQEISDSILCEREELDLGITLKGGQSFRWTACDSDGKFRGVFGSTVWTLSQNDNKIIYTMHQSLQKGFKCEEVLSNYFRLDVSLKENIKTWANSDSHFKSVYDKIGAVRILDQDVVENIFSFICSSNNNIQRISGMVEKLSRIFGEKIGIIDGKEYYDFPTIEALSKPNVELILRQEGFGYRAGYIAKSAQKLLTLGGRQWLQDLKKESGTTYEHARESLMSLPGIGPKVADCVCLMSLGHLEAIPVDTHIFQIACANYIPHLSKQKSVTPKIHQEVNNYLRELWGPLAGWAQAIVFCVKINSTDRYKSKSNKRTNSDEKQKSVKVNKSKKSK